MLDAVVARDAAALNAEVERCFEQGARCGRYWRSSPCAPAHRAGPQPVPASVDADPDAAHIQRLAQALSAEEVQLYTRSHCTVATITRPGPTSKRR